MLFLHVISDEILSFSPPCNDFCFIENRISKKKFLMSCYESNQSIQKENILKLFCLWKAAQKHSKYLVNYQDYWIEGKKIFFVFDDIYTEILSKEIEKRKKEMNKFSFDVLFSYFLIVFF
jgi:hypothetical protein